MHTSLIPGKPDVLIGRRLAAAGALVVRRSYGHYPLRGFGPVAASGLS